MDRRARAIESTCPYHISSLAPNTHGTPRATQGYLVATDPAHLVATLQAQRYEGLAARPAPTPGLLPALLDEEMGFVAVGGGGGARQGQGPEEVVEEAAAVGGGGGTRRRGGRRSD